MTSLITNKTNVSLLRNNKVNRYRFYTNSKAENSLQRVVSISLAKQVLITDLHFDNFQRYVQLVKCTLLYLNII